MFTGNPGTGKTTVARLLSQILRSLGVVSKGHLVETDRSHLVAGYVGQTAVRTREVMESALGGTLLIDEAYALARGSEQDFGREAIDTIVKFMEDHRDDLAVIAAGYPEEMATLIDANPGLKSRFTRTIHFPDYTTDELVAIFRSMGDANRYQLDDAAPATASTALDRRRAAHPRASATPASCATCSSRRSATRPSGWRASSTRPTSSSRTASPPTDIVAPEHLIEASDGSAGGALGAAGAAGAALLGALGQQDAGLLGHRRHQQGDHQVDEVAGEQPVALVRALGGAAAELDVGEAHRRVAPVQRWPDDARAASAGRPAGSSG